MGQLEGADRVADVGVDAQRDDQRVGRVALDGGEGNIERVAVLRPCGAARQRQVQRVAEARANANAQIETARGEAESIRLRGDALRANPQLIDQIYAQRSQGLCPPRASTCIIGQGAWGLTNQQAPVGD